MFLELTTEETVFFFDIISGQTYYFFQTEEQKDINYAGGYLPDITVEFILLTLYLFAHLFFGSLIF